MPSINQLAQNRKSKTVFTLKTSSFQQKKQGATTLKEWLAQAPYTLTLSSGFFGFFAHAGVVCALEEEELFPQQITGSSAGALVGASWAAGLSAEKIREELFLLQRKDFWDPYPGFGLLRGQLFQKKLLGFLPTNEFARCRIPLSISICDGLFLRTRVVQEGDLPSAIRASCTVPFLFHPVWINKKPYWDGGVFDHAGLRGVPSGNRVLYHHLLSNPKKPVHKYFPSRFNSEEVIALSMSHFEKVGPFLLENGPKNYFLAYESTKEALKQEISNMENF